MTLIHCLNLISNYPFFTVVMAKGIGNGFPMGAVATTPEIAETMGKALHFNTFGGNPIACSVGSAVLDVRFFKIIFQYKSHA